MAARGFAVLLVAVLAAVATGCGASSTDATETSYTAQQVTAHFEQEAGARLFRKQGPGGDPAWEQLGLEEDPPRELVERFGTFSIYVVKPDEQEAIASLLRDKATGKPLPHRRGIYWELDTQSDTWIAHTRYANIVLVWFTEDRDAEVDARWHRLHRMLRDLTA
jgi:hypothetical protein